MSAYVSANVAGHCSHTLSNYAMNLRGNMPDAMPQPLQQRVSAQPPALKRWEHGNNMLQEWPLSSTFRFHTFFVIALRSSIVLIEFNLSREYEWLGASARTWAYGTRERFYSRGFYLCSEEASCARGSTPDCSQQYSRCTLFFSYFCYCCAAGAVRIYSILCIFTFIYIYTTGVRTSWLSLSMMRYTVIYRFTPDC